jgi:two-component system, LytTR family, sensor kinase
MNRFLRYRLDHILFWALTVGFHAYTRLDLIDKANIFQFTLEILIRNALLAGVIYFNLRVVVPRISKGRVFVWITASIGSLVFYAVAKTFHDIYLYENIAGAIQRVAFQSNTFYNFSIVLFYLAFAAAIYLSKQWYVQRELLRQVQMEKLNTELEYLKAQMNPHFLFNSINTIFFQINKDNTEARETLGKFSDMLRYQLYECSSNEIAIEKELAYLKNYVELQKLRRNQNDVIEFTVDDDLRNFSIQPMLLIPFIENAFKHISTFTDQPNEVSIQLQKIGQNLQLVVSNTTNGSTKESGGIGLKNVKRRLQLLFPNRHTLDVQPSNNHFIVTLTLQLA